MRNTSGYVPRPVTPKSKTPITCYSAVSTAWCKRNASFLTVHINGFAYLQHITRGYNMPKTGYEEKVQLICSLVGPTLPCDVRRHRFSIPCWKNPKEWYNYPQPPSSAQTQLVTRTIWRASHGMRQIQLGLHLFRNVGEMNVLYIYITLRVKIQINRLVLVIRIRILEYVIDNL
jgi:hypothetical protein